MWNNAKCLLFRGSLAVGAFNYKKYAHLASRLFFYWYQCTCQIRKQSDKNIWGLNRRLNFFYFYQNFRRGRPHHRADICIKKEKKNTSDSYMGHNATKMRITVTKWAGYRGHLRYPILGKIYQFVISGHIYCMYKYTNLKQYVCLIFRLLLLHMYIITSL